MGAIIEAAIDTKHCIQILLNCAGFSCFIYRNGTQLLGKMYAARASIHFPMKILSVFFILFTEAILKSQRMISIANWAARHQRMWEISASHVCVYDLWFIIPKRKSRYLRGGFLKWWGWLTHSMQYDTIIFSMEVIAGEAKHLMTYLKTKQSIPLLAKNLLPPNAIYYRN